MIIRDIDKYKSIYDKVDALIIVNEENMILYSAMINDDRTYISTKAVSYTHLTLPTNREV